MKTDAMNGFVLNKKQKSIIKKIETLIKPVNATLYLVEDEGGMIHLGIQLPDESFPDMIDDKNCGEECPAEL